MSIETFQNLKERRYAVSQKLPYNDRYKSDFKFMHPTYDQARVEAERLAQKYSRDYYVVEILSVVKFTKDEEALPPGPPDPPELSTPLFA